MSYTLVENGLLAIIRKLENYGATNSSIGDYRILGNGSNRYAILNPGPLRRHGATATLGPQRRMGTVWVVNLSLIIPWRGEVSTINSQIRTDRQELINQVDAYPTLDGVAGVILAALSSANEPEHWIGEERNFWHQLMTVTIEHRQNIGLGT